MNPEVLNNLLRTIGQALITAADANVSQPEEVLEALASEIAPATPPVETPPAAAPPQPAKTEEVQLDSKGRPWTEGIHSGGKRINRGDGRWSLKRGVTRAQEDAHFATQGTVTPEAAVAAATSSAPLVPPAAAPASHGKNVQDVAVAVAKLCEGGGTNQKGIDFTVSRAIFGDAVTEGGLGLIFSGAATQEQIDAAWTAMLGTAAHLKKEI